MFTHLDDPDPPLYDQRTETAVRRRAGQIRRHRRGAALTAVLVGVAAAVVAGVLLTTAPARRDVQVVTPPPSGPTRHVSGRLPAVISLSGTHRSGPTPTRNLLRSDFTTVADLPASATVVDGSILYVLESTTEIERLDPSTGKVAAAATLPKLTSPPFEASGGVWIGAGRSIIELGPGTLRIERTVTAPGAVDSVAVAGGNLWFVVSGRIYRQALDATRPALVSLPADVDPDSPSTLVETVSANAGGTELAATLLRGAAFVGLDPATGAVTGRYQVQANNVTIAGIAGGVAWVVGGVGHNNVLAGVDLRTGIPVPITGSGPTSKYYNGGGGFLALTGSTLLETDDGDGPDACIDPASGRVRTNLLIPPLSLTTAQNTPGLRLIGVFDGELFAETVPLGSDSSSELLRARVPGCG